MKNLNENSALNPSFFIPDLCKTSTLLLSILVAELCVLAWQLAEMSFNWGQLGFRSLTVMWIVLVSAASLCRLRPLLSRLTVRRGWFLCFTVIELIGVAVIVLGYLFLNPSALTLDRIMQGALAIAIVAAMVLRYFQLLQTVIDQNQAEVTSRMDALQARIKPHFLFNSLNTIAELIATRPEEAEKSLENLSTLFRANLKENSSFCPLQQEMTLVKGYLELEQWRLGSRLQVNWHCSLLDDQWPVPVLCLQPLVENAVVHGVASQTEGGEINIQVLQTPRITTLSVENSIGAYTGQHEGHGVGLNNVKHRLSVLYGPSARCHIEQTKRRYKVTVILPKNSVQEVT